MYVYSFQFWAKNPYLALKFPECIYHSYLQAWILAISESLWICLCCVFLSWFPLSIFILSNLKEHKMPRFLTEPHMVGKAWNGPDSASSFPSWVWSGWIYTHQSIPEHSSKLIPSLCCSSRRQEKWPKTAWSCTAWRWPLTIISFCLAVFSLLGERCGASPFLEWSFPGCCVAISSKLKHFHSGGKFIRLRK